MTAAALALLILSAFASEAEETYTRAQKLIEENCAECYKASMRGLERGIEELRRAIALGRNDVEAHRLLLYALRNMTYGHLDELDAEYVHYERLLHEEIRILSALDPSDVANRLYAIALFERPEERAAETERLVAEAPHAPEAQLALARVSSNRTARPTRSYTRSAGCSSPLRRRRRNTARASSARSCARPSPRHRPRSLPTTKAASPR